MGVFGIVKTTIVCHKVNQCLHRLHLEESPIANMFMSLLKQAGLTWNLTETLEGDSYDLQGSWEAMLKAYGIFTAIQTSEMSVENDIEYLFKWCQDCLVNLPHIPVNDTDANALRHLLKTLSTPKKYNTRRHVLANGGQGSRSEHDRHGDLPKEEPNKEFEDVQIKEEIDKISEPDDSFNNTHDTNIDDKGEDNEEDEEVEEDEEDEDEVKEDESNESDSDYNPDPNPKPHYKTPAHVRARRKRLYKPSRAYPKYRAPPQQNWKRNKKKYSSVYMQNKLTQRQVFFICYTFLELM